MALKAKDILEQNDRAIESVLVPEWGGMQVWIRTMGAIERARYEAMLVDNKDASLSEKMAQVKVMLVLLCVCDENGNRIFTDDQFDAVADKSGDAIDRLFDVINRLNMVSQGEVEAEKGN